MTVSKGIISLFGQISWDSPHCNFPSLLYTTCLFSVFHLVFELLHWSSCISKSSIMNSLHCTPSRRSFFCNAWHASFIVRPHSCHFEHAFVLFDVILHACRPSSVSIHIHCFSSFNRMLLVLHACEFTSIRQALHFIFIRHSCYHAVTCHACNFAVLHRKYNFSVIWYARWFATVVMHVLDVLVIDSPCLLSSSNAYSGSV